MIEWLSTREPLLIYVFLFFSALLESLFPPYPSDAFILVFAFFAGRGNYCIFGVYLFTVFGSIAGIMIIYYIGKVKGNALIQFLSRTFLGRIFPIKLIERAKQKFTQKGNLIILLNRFLPGMRAPICFAAGMVNIGSKKFFVFNLISVFCWNLFLVLVGFYVGRTWDAASSFLKNYNIIVTAVIIAVLIVSTIIYFRKQVKLRFK